MDKLIKAFWDMCLLRRAPQDVPRSQIITGGALLAYAILSFCGVLLRLPPESALLFALIDVGLLVAFTLGALWIRFLSNRWQQTLAAMAGTGAVLEAVALPVFYWQTQVANSQLEALPVFVLWLLMIWNLAVIANIMRHSLNVPMLISGVFSLLYIYLSLRVLGTIFFMEPR